MDFRVEFISSLRSRCRLHAAAVFTLMAAELKLYRSSSMELPEYPNAFILTGAELRIPFSLIIPPRSISWKFIRTVD